MNDLKMPDVEPAPEDLSAIEAEWPLIEAELNLLDAEIRLICTEDRGGPTDLDWQRVRRARRRVLRAAADLLGRPEGLSVLTDAA